MLNDQCIMDQSSFTQCTELNVCLLCVQAKNSVFIVVHTTLTYPVAHLLPLNWWKAACDAYL